MEIPLYFNVNPCKCSAELHSLNRYGHDGRPSPDRIIAEVNNGGYMVENALRTVDRNVSYGRVWATKGEFVRAEPVSSLYQQGRVHHVGSFDRLEDQMCAFTADFDRKAMGYSPDRMDALVCFSIHDIDLVDGSTPTMQDRLIGGLQLAVANADGSGSVTTAVSFPAGSLPANYAVFVDAGQAVTAYLTGKTSSGFNIVLAATSVAAGTFNVLIVA